MAEGKTGKGRGGARPALGSDPVWGKSIIDWLTGALTAHSRRKAETTSAKAKQEPSPARWEGLDFRPAELLLDSGSQWDFRAPSTPLFIPQIYNLQSGMKPLSHLVRTAQFSVRLELHGSRTSLRFRKISRLGSVNHVTAT